MTMMTNAPFYQIYMTFFFAVFVVATSTDAYFIWTPPNGTRQDLFCSDECYNPDQYDKDQCCSCDAKQCWEIESIAGNRTLCDTNMADLYIEPTDILGNGLVVPDLESIVGDVTNYRLIHRDGFLSSLPGNLCAYPSTVYVDLRNNLIEHITDIACLASLNTLFLQHNPIKTLPVDTFKPLLDLRYLDMSYTAVTALEPWVLETNSGPIETVKLTGLEFDEFDMTNMITSETICERLFNNGTIPTMTNKLNFNMTATNRLYGGGELSFNNSKLHSLINLTTVGLVDYNDVHLYLRGKIYLTGASITCDCTMVKLIKSAAYPEVLRYWTDLSKPYTCSAPENMKGFVINSQGIAQISLDRFVCDIGVECPSRCTCTDIPSREVVQVNCSNAGLTEMPDVMPVGYWGNNQLELLLDNNQLSHLEQKSYFDRIKSIDLSNNPIKYASEAAFKTFQEHVRVDIKGHLLERVPISIQLLDPHNLEYGSTPVICDCNNTWIGDWLRSYDARGTMHCLINGHTRIDGFEVSDAMLDCKPEEDMSPFFILGISLGLLALIIVCLVVAYLYRYYILILFRRRCVRYDSLTDMNNPFDVFVTYDCEDDMVRKSVRSEILDGLKYNGYITYCPYTDPLLASVKEENVRHALAQSSVFLVVFSREYLLTEECSKQFELTWKAFRRNTKKKLIILDVSDLSTKDVACAQMKALLKVGRPLDFKPTKEQILTRLCKRLGPPRRRTLFRLVRGNEETAPANTMFSQQTIVHNPGRNQSPTIINEGNSFVSPRQVSLANRYSLPLSSGGMDGTASTHHRKYYESQRSAENEHVEGNKCRSLTGAHTGPHSVNKLQVQVSLHASAFKDTKTKGNVTLGKDCEGRNSTYCAGMEENTQRKSTTGAVLSEYVGSHKISYSGQRMDQFRMAGKPVRSGGSSSTDHHETISTDVNVSIADVTVPVVPNGRVWLTGNHSRVTSHGNVPHNTTSLNTSLRQEGEHAGERRQQLIGASRRSNILAYI